jgi:hypothetical protein
MRVLLALIILAFVAWLVTRPPQIVHPYARTDTGLLHGYQKEDNQ